VCSTCGGTFVFHQGEAKLKGMEEFDKLRADVDELKQRLPASTPAAPQPPEEPSDSPDSPFDDDDSGDEDLEEEL